MTNLSFDFVNNAVYELDAYRIGEQLIVCKPVKTCFKNVISPSHRTINIQAIPKNEIVLADQHG